MTTKDPQGELLKLVIVACDCRRAQKAYFRQRDPGNLRIAKDAERRLDALLDEHTKDRPRGLFSEEEGGAGDGRR